MGCGSEGKPIHIPERLNGFSLLGKAETYEELEDVPVSIGSSVLHGKVIYIRDFLC